MCPEPGQKTVLITGCTPGGIGHALAMEFHSKGVYVIATARRLEVIDHLDAIGITTYHLDVTEPDSIERCAEDVFELTGGKLDILVNNAGQTHTHPATDLYIPDVRETFETNVFGVMAVVQVFTPLLIEAEGLIVNIASLAAITPYVFGSAYCASKGALVSYSRCLRQELRPFGVRVTVAMTGTVKSNTASQPKRDLPEDSLYTSVRDLFEARLAWSQTNNPMPTEEYARKLVKQVLRPEAPFWARSWFGRPDWFWGGGMATMTWLGSCIGEWIIDMVCWKRFGLWRLEEMVRMEAAQKKLR